jgi:hypothetical protein
MKGSAAGWPWGASEQGPHTALSRPDASAWRDNSQSSLKQSRSGVLDLFRGPQVRSILRRCCCSNGKRRTLVADSRHGSGTGSARAISPAASLGRKPSSHRTSTPWLCREHPYRGFHSLRSRTRQLSWPSSTSTAASKHITSSLVPTFRASRTGLPSWSCPCWVSYSPFASSRTKVAEQAVSCRPRSVQEQWVRSPTALHWQPHSTLASSKSAWCCSWACCLVRLRFPFTAPSTSSASSLA